MAKRLEKVLAYIKSCPDRPTRLQIAQDLDMPYSMAYECVRVLIKQGELDGGKMVSDSRGRQSSNDLTSRQREILDWLRSEASRDRYPSIREIGDHFGIASPNGVMSLLKALEKKGHITRSEEKSRSIRIVGYDRADVTARLEELEAKIGDLVDGGDLGDFCLWYVAWKKEGSK